MSEDRPPRVLVVDDDQAVRASLRRALGLEGYEVSVAPDGVTAINLLPDVDPDVIVLDIMMPGVDGLGVVRRLRQDGCDTPILMLTARDAVPDRVAGLTTGADDYLIKPFALEELIARMEALLRRAVGADDDDVEVYRFADVVVDVSRARASRGGVDLALTSTEFDLLLSFVEEPRRVLSRDVLLERVWGIDSDVTSNTVEVYIGYLRRKLEAGGRPRLIHTVRGRGYMLEGSS
ncbi:MAG: response regulator transcription factor [Actinomycetota bacterium]